MKNLVLALALCLSAIPSFGRDGNDGPNAAPQMPGQPIAQVSVSSFFHHPDSPSSETVNVMPNGRVVVTKIYRDGRSELSTLAVLSSETVEKLAANVKAVSKGELVDPNPQSPSCMDAPSTSYLANVSGKLELIQQNVGCKTFSKKEANMADHQVVRTLKALLDLASLREPRN